MNFGRFLRKVTLIRDRNLYRTYSGILKMQGVRRSKRIRDHLEVSVDDIKQEADIKSKYFKTEEDTSVKLEPVIKEEFSPIPEDDVDTDWVKLLDNKPYFEWISKRTSDNIKDWSRTLDLNIFTDNSKEVIPDNFIPIYSKVRLMRSKIRTPVDTVGCAMLPITVGKESGIEKEDILPINYRLQVLIGVMLSSQTKDEINAAAMHNITEYCINELEIPEGITIDALLEIDQEILDELIHSVGFHSRKAKYLKETALILKEKHNSDIPTNIEGLLALPGVGPKMGYLTLQKAWGKIDGICVDVHVHRLAKMWKWVDEKKCKTPEHTRKELESWLPRQLWYEINSVLVGFGQVICMSRGKRCDICLANDVCNARDKKLVNKGINMELEGGDGRAKTTRGDYSELLQYIKEENGKLKIEFEQIIEETRIKSEF
ncbi:hypothetical protein Kpol_1040p22 [Vanderwaltozyma polyspora DSM 70294]|uniref:Endonuclease III homolog n=1 Tax=Vanderwaltozyma polyspora (strain ATCC 22028 / DSM 70294 / BCRC 21397 / CBS 2163 / NBRC 10782 / NRRL Y-8283 / UCD 57-17) TaxID=436907 RepID=A7TPL7_VANPO|nr:uncharacterized protein Kpol_1040p22 [Vanderwaltozyma polyspora DSM 70294]EDO15809.1 hypothetical protein Kpol_1040p22 [Vanderwaltozyma polyspora DSM 70294]